MQGGRDNGYPQHRRQPMEPEDDYDGDYPDDEPHGHAMNREENGDQLNDASGAEDAVLDLAELEQLQEEAERMKGLGNKHMAAQVSTYHKLVLRVSPLDTAGTRVPLSNPHPHKAMSYPLHLIFSWTCWFVVMSHLSCIFHYFY